MNFNFKENLDWCENLTPQPERNSFLFLALGELWEIKKVGVEDGNRRPNKKLRKEINLISISNIPRP